MLPVSLVVNMYCCLRQDGNSAAPPLDDGAAAGPHEGHATSAQGRGDSQDSSKPLVQTPVTVSCSGNIVYRPLCLGI